MSLLVLVAAVWILCGVFAYGFTFAHFQDTWKCYAWPHRHADRGIALFTACMGPLGLLVVLFQGGYNHGLRWHVVSPDESWADFHRRFGLGRGYWEQL